MVPRCSSHSADANSAVQRPGTTTSDPFYSPGVMAV
jgi:hypothetical protein